MKALILSGGTGTRLRPLTYSTPKQLIPLVNKPILFYIIEKVVRSGITDIGIVVGDTYEQIKTAVGNGDKWNVDITYIHQPLPLGLAHAVKTASDFIGEDSFLMILGDNLFHMELGGFIKSFQGSSSNASILLHYVDEPSSYGVAVVENDQVVKLVEKPSIFVSNLIITGIYIFDKRIFEAIDNTLPSPRGELEITDAIQKLLDMGGKVSYKMTEGWWKDTGKPSDILEANKLILEDISAESWTCQEDVASLIGSLHIGKSVVVKNSTIHSHVAIGDNSFIQGSGIGPFTSVGNGVNIINCNVANSIILDGAQLIDISKDIRNSIIGKNTIIKSPKTLKQSMDLITGDNCNFIL